MALSRLDLKKIKEIVSHEVNHEVNTAILGNNKKLFEVFATKQDLVNLEQRLESKLGRRISAVEDLVLQLHQKFDVEFTIVTMKTVKDHEVRIGRLEENSKGCKGMVENNV